MELDSAVAIEDLAQQTVKTMFKLSSWVGWIMDSRDMELLDGGSCGSDHASSTTSCNSRMDLPCAAGKKRYLTSPSRTRESGPLLTI